MALSEVKKIRAPRRWRELWAGEKGGRQFGKEILAGWHEQHYYKRPI